MGWMVNFALNYISKARSIKIFFPPLLSFFNLFNLFNWFEAQRVNWNGLDGDKNDHKNFYELILKFLLPIPFKFY